MNPTEGEEQMDIHERKGEPMEAVPFIRSGVGKTPADSLMLLPTHGGGER